MEIYRARGVLIADFGFGQTETKRTRDQRVALESKDRIVAKLREQLQSFSRRPGSRTSMGGSTRLPGVHGDSRPDSAPYL